MRMRWRLFKASGAIDDRAAAKRHRWIGALSIAAACVLLVATGAFFVKPFSGPSYTAHMAATGGVRLGDDIRVAGVPVGKVTNVRLDRTEIRMTFTAASSVFVGAESRLSVKLLTPMGGHYVALDPEGSTPLGTAVIPSSRVVLPFTLTDILQVADPVVKKVNGQVIHDTFAELAEAVNTYPNALPEVLRAANSLTDSLSRVTADYHRVLDLAKEYSSTLAAGRQKLVVLARQVELALRLVESRAVGITYVMMQLADALRLVRRAVVFYGQTLQPTLDSIEDIFDITYAHPERVGQALDGVGQMLRIIMPMLHGEGILLNDKNQIMDENHVEPRPDICVPNIFRKC